MAPSFYSIIYRRFSKISFRNFQSEPLNDYFNVSNNENLEIKELAEFIAKTFNYTGNVVFDNNISGQFRKDDL